MPTVPKPWEDWGADGNVTSWLDREIRRAKRKPVVRPGAEVYVMSKAPKGRSLKSGCPLTGVQPAKTRLG